MSKHTYICIYCGSDAVSYDASTYWDVDKQDWELSDISNDSWCGNCEGDTCTKELYSTEEKYPSGTEKATMIKELSDSGNSANYVIIKDETDEEYATEIVGSSKSAGKIFPTKAIVILKKRDEYHWKYEVTVDA